MYTISEKILADYNFRKVTPDELVELRMGDSPAFVLKQNDTCYYSKLSDGLKFAKVTLSPLHRCANCRRLSSAQDCDGGCAKVRDILLRAFCQKDLEPDLLLTTIEKAKRIEKYPFINLGYEIFNADNEDKDKLIVLDCSCYEKYLS